ncbi:MAG: glycine C-acetyltransferase [Spirochaetaceae bacterium]|nr:glycine C-acetyltransferase [Spirochaetaceae bacterium]
MATIDSVIGPTLEQIRDNGLYKDERVITSPQGVAIQVGSGEEEVLNFCANNYLGLSSDPAVIDAAAEALRTHGFGLSSVRFICGTQDLHKRLEQALARFLGTDDAILYTSCFDANGGLFETLLQEGDAVLSDALNHASIIDGIRLCKAARYRYAHADMDDLEAKLKEAAGARLRLIATDGVFSMDGDIAPLDRIVELARAHDALVMVDDSHATGFIGATGRGSIEHCGVLGEIDVITSTLGKALGGASGGFTAARGPIVELLRQRSRPYLFSNSLPPSLAAAGLAVLERLEQTTELRDRLAANTACFRAAMTSAGFDIRPGVHPIVPIMLYEARLAQAMAADLLAEGIYVIGFSYPVVPEGQARIRVQISAAHESAHLDRAIGAFTRVGRQHGVIQ